MSQIGNVSHEIYAASYQQGEKNTSMIFRTVNYRASKNLDLSAGLGASTNFNGNSGAVIEAKAKYNIDKNFNLQLRLRDSHGTKESSAQLRFSPGYRTKVSDNTSIHVNPYVSTKYNYKTSECILDKGVYAGVTHNILPNLSFCGEVQKYNGFKCGIDNWGVNAIFKYNF